MPRADTMRGMSVRFNLDPASLQRFEEAVEYYQFESAGDYLRLCCRMLIQHHRRKDTLSVPFQFKPVPNGKEAEASQ